MVAGLQTQQYYWYNLLLNAGIRKFSGMMRGSVKKKKGHKFGFGGKRVVTGIKRYEIMFNHR
jgi:hypothetical protein